MKPFFVTCFKGTEHIFQNKKRRSFITRWEKKLDEMAEKLQVKIQSLRRPPTRIIASDAWQRGGRKYKHIPCKDNKKHCDCIVFYYLFFTLPFWNLKWDSHWFFLGTVFLHRPHWQQGCPSYSIAFRIWDGLNHPTGFIIRCSLIAWQFLKFSEKNARHLQGNRSRKSNADGFPKRKDDGIRTWIRSWKWKWMMMKHLLFVKFHFQGPFSWVYCT